MSKRLPCPPAPGPLQDYVQSFDDLFSTLAQRRDFREYLQKTAVSQGPQQGPYRPGRYRAYRRCSRRPGAQAAVLRFGINLGGKR